jgi:hypothetical protein
MFAFTRRTMLGGAVMFATGCTKANAAAIVVYRDPDCGCCEAWTKQLKARFQRPVEVIDTPDRRPVQQRAGMPGHLASCHTALIDGLTFEGHVPPTDVELLLAQRPAGVNGLAVPGMPVGSPGMETDPPQHESYDVVAFGLTFTPYVFAHHG